MTTAPRPRRSPVEETRFRTLPTQRFVDFWCRLRGAALLPDYADYDPAAIPTLASMVMQRNVEPDGSARFRHVGAGVLGLFGNQLTGGDAAAVMPEAQRERYRRSSRIMFELPCGVWALFSIQMASGRRVLVENVGFPFGPEPDGRRITISHMAIVADTIRICDETAGISRVEDQYYLDIGAGLPVAA